jgi:pilus assembly protein CpaF
MSQNTNSTDLLFNSSKSNPSFVFMNGLMEDPDITEIVINGHTSIFYMSASKGKVRVPQQIFSGKPQYIEWLDNLLSYTDSGFTSVAKAQSHVIEGSFTQGIEGSLHICTKEITRGEPYVTIRKQPDNFITLDAMVAQKLMSPEIAAFLKQAVRGGLNIVISGGSGAGKTTLARALAHYIPPDDRIVTVEEIDELRLIKRLPNAVSLTTFVERDEHGKTIRAVSLEDLVREVLRMRAQRIWVGEVRGREAYALVKACNSGHDGSLTTIHADDGAAAAKQLVTYVMEGNLSEEVARDQVSRAFHIVIQLNRINPTTRRITEITELEQVREGTEQRRNPLFSYDYYNDNWIREGHPTARVLTALTRNGVNYTSDY